MAIPHERARQDAFELMMRPAAEVGATAVIAPGADANEVVTEVPAYGTAVVIEPASR